MITFKSEFTATRISLLTDLEFSISTSDTSNFSCNCAETAGWRSGFTMLIHSSCICPNSCLQIEWQKNLTLLFKACADGHNTQQV